MKRQKAMGKMLREITEKDIPDLFKVRVRTHENCLTYEQLKSLGITEESVKARLEGSLKGWLYEVDNQVVGFAMGDGATGEMWVIAVLPEFVGKGIGSKLLIAVENWLFACGCQQLWLTTDIDTSLKAYSFYRQHGWIDTRIEDGMRYMAKTVKSV
jgi:ribosomal protein S18 acetylase RimI-like enzyme